MTSLWITRSEPGAQRLAEALADSGLDLWVQPLLEIQPIPNWDLPVPHAATRLPEGIIVTSQHAAVQYVGSDLFSAARGQLHIALGAASAAVLRAAECQVVLPQHQSSEGVLELAEIQALPTAAMVWIIGGEGGRDVLQDMLAKHHLEAVKFESYRRIPTAGVNLKEAPDLIEIASYASLRLAVERLPRVDQTVFIVASERLRSAARELKLVNIESAAGADVTLMRDAVLKAVEKQL